MSPSQILICKQRLGQLWVSSGFRHGLVLEGSVVCWVGSAPFRSLAFLSTPSPFPFPFPLRFVILIEPPLCLEQQRNSSHGHAVEQIELLIDEKCRILNKTGTPKSSALHLANWMKGQLDKQQQQARLAAIARSQENISAEDEQLIFNSDSEQDERITYWTRQQLEKRTKELNLAKENGGLSAKPNFGGKRLSGVEELSMSGTSEIYSEAEVVTTSQISQSHSTTSDSQVSLWGCVLCAL